MAIDAAALVSRGGAISRLSRASLIRAAVTPRGAKLHRKMTSCSSSSASPIFPRSGRDESRRAVAPRPDAATSVAERSTTTPKWSLGRTWHPFDLPGNTDDNLRIGLVPTSSTERAMARTLLVQSNRSSRPCAPGVAFIFATPLYVYPGSPRIMAPHKSET